MKLQFHHIQRGVVLALLVTLWAAIESVSAVGAFHHEADPVRGIQMAVLTVSCAAIAFIGFGLAGRLKDDERPHVRRRAMAARVVAVLFLFIGPIPFFGSALKAENQAREWAAYTASAAYAADQELVSDPMADMFERRSARERLIEPVNANLDPADGEFWLAFLIQGLLIFASDALRVPAPITEAERQTLMFKLRGQKAAATRKARKAAKAKAAKPRLIQGGKN